MAQEMVRFYQARKGCLNSFRFFDHLDHTSKPNGRDNPAATDILIGVGDGVTTQFQLKKVYAEGNESSTRNITKIIHGETIGDPYNVTYNVLVALNDVPQGSGWSVNVQTGIVTFSVAPANGVTVKAGFAFDTPTFFETELDRAIQPEHVDFDQTRIDAVPLVEDTSNIALYEELNFGGGSHLGTIIADTTLSQLNGVVQTFACNTAGLKLLLPDFTNLPLGRDYFHLCNLGGSQNIQLTDSSGLANVALLVPDQVICVDLGVDGSGNKIWLPRGT